MNKILRPVFRSKNVFPFKESKRFAGHSEWQNRKHGKEKNDQERALIIIGHLRKMRSVIAEFGNAYPEQNMKLAYLVEEAKQKQIPNSTVKGFLEKMQAEKIKSYNFWFNVQGPDGCLIIFNILTDNVVSTKNTLVRRIKKFTNCRMVEGSIQSAFDIEGVIIMEKFCDIDAATDLAIEAGAEEVSEIEKDGKTHLKFTCSPEHLMVVKHKLQKSGKVISAKDEYTPHNLVEVSSEGLNIVGQLIDKVGEAAELVEYYDNIA